MEEGAERSDGKGTERELGIWPDESPARGSGEVPSKLQIRESIPPRIKRQVFNAPTSRPGIKHDLGRRFREVVRRVLDDLLVAPNERGVDLDNGILGHILLDVCDKVRLDRRAFVIQQDRHDGPVLGCGRNVNS